MSLKVIIYRGLPGSGKSTHSKAWVEEDPTHRGRINYDELRREMFGDHWKFNRKDEKIMQANAYHAAETALQTGLSLAIDNTNLSDHAVEEWATLAARHNAEVEIVDLRGTPIRTCLQRDAQREGRARVGRAVIERMALFNDLIDWDGPDYGPESFVLVDIDGTLSDTSKRQHYVETCKGCAATEDHTEGERSSNKCVNCGRRIRPDWASFYAEVANDAPKKVIVDLVRGLALDYNIIIVSGRSPENGCGLATEAWLDKHLGRKVYQHLFMRNAGDSRADYIIKGEILDHLPKDRIAFVLDDRDQVVRMWRDRGLTCLQVAYGDF